MEGELVANIQRRSSLDYGAENARFELCRANLCAATVQQRGEACANNRTGFLLYLWFKQSPPGKEGSTLLRSRRHEPEHGT